MARGKEMLHTGKQVADDLEPYRRLIEVQKQLVQIAEQHEQARRECDVLREQIARELMRSRHWRARLRRTIRRSAAKFLKRLPRIASPAMLSPAPRANKNHSHAESN